MQTLMEVVTGYDSTMIKIAESIVGENHFYFAAELGGVTAFIVNEDEALEIQRRLYQERHLLAFIMREN